MPRLRTVSNRCSPSPLGANAGSSSTWKSSALLRHARLQRRGTERARQLAHSATSKATACAEMPSPRPVKPSFSLVVALTLMQSSSTCSSAARRSPHRLRVRADLGPFADHGDIGIAQAPAARMQQAHAVIEELRAVGALPARIRWREMLADVAQRQRAEQGVAQRVDHHVAIAVGKHAALVRHAHAAEHDVVALAEGVDVIALADAERKRSRGTV